MPIIWTLDCFLRLYMYIYSILYSIYSIFSPKLTSKSWILTSEKSCTSCPNWREGEEVIWTKSKRTAVFSQDTVPLNNLENFRLTWKVSRLSGKFLDDPEKKSTPGSLWQCLFLCQLKLDVSHTAVQLFGLLAFSSIWFRGSKVDGKIEVPVLP